MMAHGITFISHNLEVESEAQSLIKTRYNNPASGYSN